MPHEPRYQKLTIRYIQTLIDILNNCLTYPGKRTFLYQLCNPITNIEKLNKRYDLIEFFKTNTFDLVFTVSKSDRSPYVNMVEFNNNREVLLSKEIDSNKVFRRQDSPEVFNIVPSVYVTSPEYILKTDSMWSGKLSGYEVPDTRAVDIDTNTDFKLAEMLFEGSIN